MKPPLKLISLLLVAGLAACAGHNQQLAAQVEQSQGEVRDDLEALKQAVEASYDREKAMAERLRQAEEGGAQLREDLHLMQSQLDLLRRQLAAPQPAGAEPPAPPEVFSLYRAGRESYETRHYDRAIAQFTQLLEAAPEDDLADNAQYWIGECYYGLGKYRQALTAFAKIFVYAKTEKAADAQLKIARCHLALEEPDKARAAYQKLLDEYPDSQYAPTARRGLQDLEH
ncbi:MAG: tetratricopeptide repeat protein [Candidatus Latescibacteria bacterium]|nr:tetratricopeptide repeat protein [Candidatus Latescibacterota bacterium]